MSKKCYRRMFYQNKNYKQHKDHETKTEIEFSDISSEESSVGHKESSGEEPLLSVSRQRIIVSESERETLSSQDTEQPSRYLMSRTEEGLEQKHGDRKILQSPTSEGSDKDKAANNKTVSETIIIKKKQREANIDRCQQFLHPSEFLSVLKSGRNFCKSKKYFSKL